MLKRPLVQQLHLLVQCQLVRTTVTHTRKPPISQKVRFIDQIRITVRGGHGGGGSSALFGRTGHHPRAAGGNGAPGGAVILQGSKQLTGLGTIPLHLDADRGGSGGKQWRDGKKGADKVVHVPLGTQVYQLVELQPGAGKGKVHGVTALPHQVTATPASASAVGVQQQQQQPGCDMKQDISPAASDQPQDHVGKSQQQCSWEQALDVNTVRSPIHISKRLFQGGEPQAAVPLGDKDPQQPISSLEVMTDQHAHDSLTAAHSDGHTSDADHNEGTSLYQQLLRCDRVLTNNEKLHLLHSGSLQGDLQQEAAQPSMLPAYTAWDQDSCSSSSSSRDCPDESNANNNSLSCSETDSEEDWSDQSATGHHDGAKDVGSGRDIWVGDPADIAGRRSFTKQQVWSILESQAVLLGELTAEGQQLVVATGGLGGRGNAVAHSRPNAPASRARSEGTPGQEVMLLLKLSLLADVVLVGLPNVGKSSLITALTNANAQVGSYAFTTLRPQLGTMVDVVPYNGAEAQVTGHAGEDSSPNQRISHKEAASTTREAEEPSTMSVESAAAVANSGASVDGSSRIVIADLPGLLPGAHAGKGRGTAFLAHLQKARCLALVIDMIGNDADQQLQEQSRQLSDCKQKEGAWVDAPETSWRGLVPYTPQQQLSILQEELSSYDSSILAMPMVVVANKLDALSPDAGAAAVKQLKSVTTLPIIPVSAEKGAGLQRLKSALHLLVNQR